MTKDRLCSSCGNPLDDDGRAVQHCEDCAKLHYGRIPEHLLYCQCDDLSVYARLVFIDLDRRGWDRCFPSAKGIASRLNIDVKTVRRALEQLVKSGVLKCDKATGRNNTYAYNGPEYWIKTLPARRSDPTRQTGRGTYEGLPVRGTDPTRLTGTPPTRQTGTVTRAINESHKRETDVPHVSQTQSGQPDPQQEYDNLYAKITKEGRDVDHAPISQRDFLALNKLSVDYVADVVLWCRWLDPEWGGKDFRKSEHKRAAYSLRTLFDRWADIKADYQSSQDKHKGTPWRTNGHATRDHERAEQERRRQELRDQLARREAMTPEEREAERERIAAMRSQYGFLREPEQQED